LFDFISSDLNKEAKKCLCTKEDLSVQAPYRSSDRHDLGYKNPKGPRWPSNPQLSWSPLGKVGRCVITEDTLLSVLSKSEPEVATPDFENFFKKYKAQRPVSEMTDWLIQEGLAVEVFDETPNTAVYVKMKPDGSKLQIIADASLRNKCIPFKPKNFVLFSPEYAKPLLREPGPTFIFSFDVSNFYYAFILPSWFQENTPVILSIPGEKGGNRLIRCLRATFGDKISPVLTHQALSDVFGLPSTVYVKGVDPRPHPCPWLNEKEDVSGIYIDDIIEMSKSRERAEDRYTTKRGKVDKFDMPVKEKSIQEGSLDAEFAGKRYSGKDKKQFIANTQRNSAKLVALAMLTISQEKVSMGSLRSLVGSFAYGTCHHKKALPYLSGVNLRIEEGEGLMTLPEALKVDILCALFLSLLPWTPESEIRWSGYQPDLPLVVVDASFKDQMFGIFLFNKGECWVGSFSIPLKFADSQQTAELYGLTIAMKRGFERFGSQFNVVADSASSIASVTNLKMSSLPKVRNVLIRKVIRWSLMKNLKVSVSWTESEHNLADTPSRKMFNPINQFQKFPASEFSSYLSKSSKFFLSSHQYFQR
jgi:hypothetical protein